MFELMIDRRHAVISAELAEWMDDIFAFEESGEWMADGATSMSAWLAGRFGMARGTARELVRVARALCELPGIRDVFAAGELCFDQLKPLTRFVPSDEDEVWARRARAMSPAELWAECRRRQRRTRNEAVVDANLRFFWMGWDDDRGRCTCRRAAGGTGSRIRGGVGAGVRACLCRGRRARP
jgi:Domain of unknown function (DUF222)